ncbi:MAG: Rpn family recombination-promoting nuclease/putative transposase [Lachnospiraceae bacterium]|nr:Rpn family recombination-promoting nuclease/putative transposase [Lachnospiraceae bacterium]
MTNLTPQTPEKKPIYMQATGKLPYTLTNDYLFKALLQKNKKVLKHLVCSLLHLQPENVKSVELKNPIILGESITGDLDGKIFALDINVLLDNRILINLEMQVVNHMNWPERSLTYLCRNFDQLSRGQDYTDIKPTIHIGFLDFTLFPEYPEFYATYKMTNVKNHHIYTDNFVLSVVNLKHIELATQEDREWKTDYWASLFKATTWEELKMLAEQNPILEDAVATIYEITADETIREQCKAREKHVREMNTVLKEKEVAIQEKDAALQEREEMLGQLDREKQQNAQLVQYIEQLQQELKRLGG